MLLLAFNSRNSGARGRRPDDHRVERKLLRAGAQLALLLGVLLVVVSLALLALGVLEG